jgi:hypothetical protein
MKHLIIASALSLFPLSAFADYFGCELEVNGRRVSEDAEYRGREVSVAKDGFTCDGTIDLQGRQVTTALRSGFSGSRSVSAGIHRAKARIEEFGREFEGSFSEAECVCSLH